MSYIWFPVGGKPLIFSIAKFAMVFGLKIGAYPTDEEIRQKILNDVLVKVINILPLKLTLL